MSQKAETKHGQHHATNCQQKMSRRYLSLLPVFLSFIHRNWKQSSCGYLMEHLESYDIKIMMRGPIVCLLWPEDLLYTSYVERSYFTPDMMRDLLYASHDERTYCTPVMMRWPTVRQLWWEDLLCQFPWENLLYASYDERNYCMPVMIRGPIVCQLWLEDLLYVSYDERTYCMPVMMRGPIVRQL